MATITLTSQQLKDLSHGRDNEGWAYNEKNLRTVKGYEGYYLVYDVDSGEFDREKGAMYDFTVELYDSIGNCIGVGSGGYYSQDVSFNHSITFKLFKLKKDKPKAKPKVNIESDFKKGIQSILKETGKLQTKANKIKKFIAKMEPKFNTK